MWLLVLIVQNAWRQVTVSWVMWGKYNLIVKSIILYISFPQPDMKKVGTGPLTSFLNLFIFIN